MCIAVKDIMARAFAGEDGRHTRWWLSNHEGGDQVEHAGLEIPAVAALHVHERGSSPVSPNKDTRIQLCFGIV